jgi:hypothetical protein
MDYLLYLGQARGAANSGKGEMAGKGQTIAVAVNVQTT